MSRGLLIFVFGILVLGLVSGVEVDEDIRVIVLEEESVKSSLMYGAKASKVVIPSDKIDHRYSNLNGFSAKVSREEFEALKNDISKRVFIDNLYHANLDVSIPIINADDVWNLSSNGLNLTGTGQTVCVIDTGVNYNHAAFGNCYGENNASSSCTIIGGYDFVNDDEFPLDDNGHGTHVSGIIASGDSTYTGVAPNVKIVSIKALDNTGTGLGSDIAAGIDWCVNNASKFNISVISMSLGDNSTYNNYCNGNFFASFIDNAVSNGISVVVSAGNCDGVGQTSCTTGVAVPACVESAIIAGTTYDNDAIEFMRGALLQIMAPGVGIISSVIGGGFGSSSGTSMSAPHISAAIALMNQYLNISGQTKTPNEIEDILNDTGVFLDDSAGSGYNFSRLDIYSAILSVDIDVPNVTLVSPVDNHVNLSVNQSFTCNATDWQLSNVTFNLWNSSGGLYYNETKNLTGTENVTSFSLTNISLGEYDWNCLVYDVEGNSASASANFSLVIGGIEVTLNSPINDSSTNVNLTFFNCSVASDASYDLDNMTFNLWNSSGALINSSVRNISGSENVTVFNYTFVNEDNYLWECVAYNNNSNMGDGINFSVEYDISVPVISGLGESVTTSSAIVSWTTDEVANSSIAVSGGSWTNSSDNILNHSISVSSLSASTGYNYIVTSCDKAGNCGNDSGSFTTNAVAVVSNGGGGGGGGGGSTTKLVNVKAAELWEGKSESLKVNDKMTFNLASGSHSLRVERIGVDFAEIVINSEPIYLNLSIGEEVKLNLSSSLYYDLLVRLNGILNKKANISIKRIFEEIVFEEDLNESEVVDEDRVFRITEEESERDLRGLILVGVLILVVVAGFFLNRKKDKGKEARNKNGKSSKSAKYMKQNNGKQNKKVKAKAKRKG